MNTTKQTALVAVTLVAGLMAGASSADAAGQCGRASWYALHSRTASGERMNPSAMTAAHRTFPFGTKLLVTHTNTGRSVIVRINDRGPFIRSCSTCRRAAGQLGFIGSAIPPSAWPV